MFLLLEIQPEEIRQHRQVLAYVYQVLLRTTIPGDAIINGDAGGLENSPRF